MAFSSGTYTLYSPGNPVVTGTTIASTWANNTLNDIATALSTCLLKDGTQTVTANIPMAAFKLTGLGAGSANGNSLRYEQSFDANGYPFLGSVSLTAISGTNTIAGTASPVPTAYASGQRYLFIPANTNTGATTLNVSTLGAKNIFWNGAALVAGEIRANVPVEVEYDGTQFNIVGNGSSIPVGRAAANGSSLVYLGTGTASGSTSLDFTSKMDSSLYAAYLVQFADIIPATDNTNLNLQLSSDNGSSWNTAATYIYGRAQFQVNTASPAWALAGTSTDTAFVLFPNADNVGATIVGNLWIYVGTDTRIELQVFGLNQDGASYFHTEVAGVKALVATALRFIMSSGNITSGSIRLYGVRKS